MENQPMPAAIPESEAPEVTGGSNEGEKVQLKYNGRMVELGMPQIVEYAQKGLNYDKLKEKYNDLKLSSEGEEATELRERLESYQSAGQKRRRMEGDLREFRALFPDIKPEEVPEEVWQKVHGGKSLLDAFAVFAWERERGSSKAERESLAASKKAPPPIDGAQSPEGYFSEEDVNRMTRAEIEKHLKLIKKSMKYWK